MKSLLFTLAHVAVGIFVLWAIWPALQGSNDGYMTKTEGVVIAEVDSAPAIQPVVEPAPKEELVTKTEPAPTPEVVEPESKPEAIEPVTEPLATTVSDPTASSSEEGALYSVVDGNKLDADSYAGFKLFRNWCSRCHAKYGLGKDDGGIGANLIESLKVIDKDTFFSTVENGKSGQIGSMPAWKSNAKVMAGRGQLYAYLMARSDGKIGNVKPKKQK